MQAIFFNVLQSYSVVKHIYWIDLVTLMYLKCALCSCTVLSWKIEVSDWDSVSADTQY